MAIIQIEIESDGQYCGKCQQLIEPYGCALFRYSTQVLHGGRFERCNECIKAEVTMATIGGVLGGK